MSLKCSLNIWTGEQRPLPMACVTSGQVTVLIEAVVGPTDSLAYLPVQTLRIQSSLAGHETLTRLLLTASAASRASVRQGGKRRDAS